MQTNFVGECTTYRPSRNGGKETSGYVRSSKKINLSRDSSFHIGASCVQFILAEHRCIITVPAEEIVSVVVEGELVRQNSALIAPRTPQSDSTILVLDMHKFPGKNVIVKVQTTGKMPEQIWYRYVIEPSLETSTE